MPKSYAVMEKVDMIMDWIVKDGLETRVIVDRLMNDYGYGKTYAYRLVKEARKTFIEYRKETIVDELMELRLEWERLYHLMLKKGNYKQAIKALENMTKMSGGFTQKIEVNKRIIKIDMGDSPVTIPIQKTNDIDEDDDLFELPE